MLFKRKTEYFSLDEFNDEINSAKAMLKANILEVY